MYPILAVANRRPGTPLRGGAYTAAVYDPAADRSAVVRIDFGDNQVTKGRFFAAPAWSTASVDYVVTRWLKGKRAISALARQGYPDFTREDNP